MKTAAKQRAERKARASRMARLRTLASGIVNQTKLDMLLSRINPESERHLMFAAIRPYLPFDAIYDEPAPPITREQFADLRQKYAE